MTYTRNTTHDLVDVHLTVLNILSHGKLIEKFLHILHGVGAVVGGEGAGLTYGVDVSHVPDGRGDDLVLVFDEVVDLFIGGVCTGDEVVLVEVGIVRPGCVESHLTETAETVLGSEEKPLQIASDRSHR
jgi:hypothetical protein